MNQVLLGNIVCLAGSCVMVGTGLIRRKRGILLAQCAMFVLLAIGNLILGGVTGAIVDAVSIVRNVLCCFIVFTVPWRITFIVIQIVMSAVPPIFGFTAGLTVLDLLPVMGSCVFTWFLDAPDGIRLKAAIIFGQLTWCIYDFSIQNYTTLVFDVMTIVTNVIGIVMIRRGNEKKQGG